MPGFTAVGAAAYLEVEPARPLRPAVQNANVVIESPVHQSWSGSPAARVPRGIVAVAALALGAAVAGGPEPAAHEAADGAGGPFPNDASGDVAWNEPRGPAQDRSLFQVPYNGRFTFTRLRYGSAGFRRRGWSSAWSHDYPDADRNMQVILGELTSLVANTTGSNVLDLEDPEIFRFPILYMSEPGFWTITETGAANLRAHLLKGGFLIFDDFEADQWYNMAAQVARALPEGEWVEIDGSHSLFQGFFAIEDIYVPHPLVRVQPAYYAIFEDNDPAGRIVVLANHNADLAEYWEWSGQGFFPVDPTNDAYRLGVNYFIYGMTH